MRLFHSGITLCAFPFFSYILASALAFLPVIASAALLEEVVVTAQKREQSVYDVGISITAFTGDQIDQLGYTDSTKVAALAASVDVSAGGGGQNQQFVIRGASLNEFNEIAEGTTAIYLDEGYIANIGAAIFPLLDMERVEILKGPQGTLFGRNATAGLVHYISRAPTDEFEGYGDVTYGSYDQVNFQGAVSGPLGEGLSARAALYYNRHDGIYNNIYPDTGPLSAPAVGGAPPGGGKDHWNDDTIAGRLKLRFEPSEDVAIDLMGHGHRIEQGENPYQEISTIAVCDEQGRIVETLIAAPDETRTVIGPGGANVGGNCQPTTDTRPVPGGDFFGFVDPDGDGLDVSKDWAYDDKAVFEFYGINGKLSWGMGDNMTLTAISDYKKFDRIQTTDVDAGPTNQLVYEQITDQWQFSQELRLNGETERTRWVAGLYYLNVNTDFTAGFLIPPGSLFVPFGPAFGIPDGLPYDAPNDEKLETDSYSAFGQVEYDLTNSFTFTIGARIIQEEKDFSLRALASISDDLLRHDLDQPTFFFPTNMEDPSGAPYLEDTSDTLWAGKVQLDWKPNEDLLLYASVNRGVKAGSFQAPLPLTGPPLPADDIGYDEEKLLAFEGGFKAVLMGGRARVSGAVYYYDYDGYHNFSFVGVSSVVTNQEATNVGGEIDIALSPFDGFDLIMGLGAFDFTVKDVAFPGGIVGDREPTYSPDFTWSGLARYEWPLANGAMAVQMDANYRSKFYTNVNNFAANAIGDSIEGNANISYTADGGKWSLTFFINNIANARNETIKFDLATLCGCNEVAYVKPRWFGGSLRYNF